MAKKILVIDDEKLVLMTLKKLLTQNGYNVELAESGQEALEKIKKEDFDLIITDVRMPGIDGIQTIEQIRDYFKKAGKAILPEIVITGYANIENYEKAQELDVANYIYKPFDTQELLSVVKRYI